MLSQKAIGAILYKYYLKNYCESDFSFDKCELRNKIDSLLFTTMYVDDEVNAYSIFEIRNKSLDFDIYC